MFQLGNAHFRHPVIQAPMAGSQDSELALAVGRAGGLGSLPCAMLSLDKLEQELQALRSLESYNLNFFCHDAAAAELTRNAEKLQHWQQLLQPFYEAWGIAPPDPMTPASRQPYSAAQAELLAAYRPPVVSFHFGLPKAALLRQIKSWGSAVISTACTVDEAVHLQSAGVDAIILQGLEAGGHRGHFLRGDLAGQMPTLKLLEACRDKISLPLIAAGGLSTASAVRLAIASGANAVQAGTAYLLCPEAKTSAVHRHAMTSVADASTAEATQLTNLFSGRPARGLSNQLIQTLGALRDDLPAFPLCSGLLAPLRAAAEAQNRDDFSPLWAGTALQGCRVTSAAEVTQQLVAETF